MTPEAVRHAPRPNQVGDLGLEQPFRLDEASGYGSAPREAFLV